MSEDKSAPSILVVDDRADQLAQMTYALKKMGYEDLYEALSADSAFELLRKLDAQSESIDLIICDWHMPGSSGLDLLRRLRRHSYFRNISFVILTAAREEEKVRQAITEKVDAFILKPLETEHFKKVIEGLLTKNED